MTFTVKTTLKPKHNYLTSVSKFPPINIEKTLPLNELSRSHKILEIV